MMRANGRTNSAVFTGRKNSMVPFVPPLNIARKNTATGNDLNTKTLSEMIKSVNQEGLPKKRSSGKKITTPEMGPLKMPMLSPRDPPRFFDPNINTAQKSFPPQEDNFNVSNSYRHELSCLADRIGRQ